MGALHKVEKGPVVEIFPGLSAEANAVWFTRQSWSSGLCFCIFGLIFRGMKLVHWMTNVICNISGIETIFYFTERSLIYLFISE